MLSIFLPFFAFYAVRSSTMRVLPPPTSHNRALGLMAGAIWVLRLFHRDLQNHVEWDEGVHQLPFPV